MSRIQDLMQAAFLKEQKETKSDRMTFDGHTARIGASDVAGCARKTAYNILYGEPEPTLENFIRMRKGNVAEGVVESRFEIAGINFERQGEYLGETIMNFILVHPDILIEVNAPFTRKDPLPEAVELIESAKKSGKKFILIEIKTTNAIPKVPHDYWVRQVCLQTKYIAAEKGVQPEEIDAKVLALELNDGGNKVFDIEYSEAEAMLAEEDALALVNVVEDYIQWQNGEKDSMEFSVNDVPRNVGNICSVCPWAFNCLGKGEVKELPDDIAEEAVEYREFKDIEKNAKKLGEDVKKFMLKSGVSKAKKKGVTVTLRGGNKKVEVDTSKYTDQELLELARLNPSYVMPNKKELAKLINSKLPDDKKWIIEGKTVETTTNISLIVNWDKKGK